MGNVNIAKKFSKKAPFEAITDNFTIRRHIERDMDAERWDAQQKENEELLNERPEIFKI